ncbi:DUF2071 domain-containing protein [Chitinophaga rhizophila]|uniref:DUF2071 domain-containing protein n=1 Tax=Chitinophaga rhizophila TaxID=2866212 RepID=A0ABS7GJN4_9BACT|nr:DUF2071 domain-containing protein [Chitinophaga rhizophila]MBW8687922.1 DUF2071 domain-containing protein [Chitinophaga rhizophila]
MNIPIVHGLIDPRILINFTASPEAVQTILPAGFRPKLYNGHAIAGVCLIRLKHLRPKGVPAIFGLSSENGAHRIAVEWEENGITREGVYMPRRDTSSKFNVLAGGRIFPGKHYAAKFNVRESGDSYHVDYTSSDNTCISITGRVSDRLNDHSVFGNLERASAFFEKGAVGYSPINGRKLQGLELRTFTWKMQPLSVQDVYTSFFDTHNIPVRFDNALLMTGIAHEWRSTGEKRC